MSNHFLLEYLPSFYKNFLINDNGDNLLNPLFDIFTNYIGDSIYTLQQYTQLSSLEKSPLYFEETYCTIDLSNTYKNGYIIDKDIISIDNIFIDTLFNTELQLTYDIVYNKSDDIKYIVFSQTISDTGYLYIKSLKKRNNIFRNFYGKLLNHDIFIPYNCTYNNYITYTQKYKNELLAILFLRTCGPSINNIDRFIHIFLGGQFSQCNGKVLFSDDLRLVIEDIDTAKQYVYTYDISPLLVFDVNTKINKFDPVSTQQFSLLSLYRNPIDFIKYMLADYCNNMINILKIDTINNENYGFLKFDSNLNFDSNLFWDMGNGTGFDYTTIPSGTTYIDKNTIITDFKNWIDTRFENQPIYEMLRNILVINFNTNNYHLVNTILKILDDLIPVHVKLIYDVVQEAQK